MPPPPLQALFPGQPVCLLAELTHMEAQGEAKLVLQAQDASGAQLSFEAPLAAAERVPGDALAVLHAMAYIGGLLSGSSHLHLKADGTPLDKQPEADIVKDEVRGPGCVPGYCDWAGSCVTVSGPLQAYCGAGRCATAVCASRVIQPPACLPCVHKHAARGCSAAPTEHPTLCRYC